MSLTALRLSLRPVLPADADALLALDSDPAVMAYLTGGVPSSRSTVRAAIDSWAAHYVEHPGFGCFVASSSSAFVGWFSLMRESAGVGSLGYRLMRSAWGRGLAREGAAALIDYGWSLGLSVIKAQTMAINLRSRSVMGAVGMRLTRTWHEHFEDPIPGTEYGEVEYSVAAPSGSFGLALLPSRLGDGVG